MVHETENDYFNYYLWKHHPTTIWHFAWHFSCKIYDSPIHQTNCSTPSCITCVKLLRLKVGTNKKAVFCVETWYNDTICTYLGDPISAYSSTQLHLIRQACTLKEKSFKDLFSSQYIYNVILVALIAEQLNKREIWLFFTVIFTTV